MKKIIFSSVFFLIMALFLSNRATYSAPVDTAPALDPVTTHPRLWLTQEDLSRLRSWAVASNPVYQNGLNQLATEAKELMDDGTIIGEDNGGTTYSPYYVEAYAHLFAFMSLVENSPEARADYAQRARTLLMYVMNQAVLGPADDVPYRDPSFATSDRSRWVGETFPLTVDWIYSTLTAEDKLIIRRVFLRWISENEQAYPNPAYFNNDLPHPFPVNDPVLLDLTDPHRSALRYSLNNYFMAHTRNTGMMALAFDTTDDLDDPALPGNDAGQLTGYLTYATGTWLYMTDYALRHETTQGISPEGFEYMPSLGFTLQFLLALHTAGQNDPAVWGPQVAVDTNPFWLSVTDAYLYSITPVPFNNPDHGEVYLPVWYGDGEHYYTPDHIRMFGPWGVYSLLTNNSAELNKTRWIQTHIPPGGEGSLLSRARSQEAINGAIMYFMVFDPAANAPTNPLPMEFSTFYDSSFGRLLARTGSSADSTLFSYKLSWMRVDHQHADGNMFDFYRKGEWLTKERTGYGATVASSDYKNSLAIQNNPVEGNPGSIYNIHAARGSQFTLGRTAGDPTILRYSDHFGQGEYVYVTGDATNLYNTDETLPYTDVEHVSRSIVWLPSDYIVVYDRAETQTDGRFKQFWLNLPYTPTITSNLVTAETIGGQQLFITSLLPAGAEMSVVSQDPTLESWALAEYDPMQVRLRVSAPNNPASARFLHVLQGADAGVTATPTTLLESTAGAPFAGALVGDTAVLFPVTWASTFTSTTYVAPAGVAEHIVTGLEPLATYDVITETVGLNVQITVQPGETWTADPGGVLWFGTNITPIQISRTFLPLLYR